MRHAVLSGLLILFFAVGAMAQSKDMETIKKLNEGFLHSIVKRDTATLSSILADDFILVNLGGVKRNKRDNVLNLLSPNIQIDSVKIDSMTVRMLTSQVGIVSAWITSAFTADGKSSTGRTCYQDIYMKRKNKWVAVAAHVTSLDNDNK